MGTVLFVSLSRCPWYTQRSSQEKTTDLVLDGVQSLVTEALLLERTKHHPEAVTKLNSKQKVGEQEGVSS